MITIENRMLEGKLENIKKAIEILGGKEELNTIGSKEEVVLSIIESAMKGEEVTFTANGKQYTLAEVNKAKLEYEKYLIKNKSKVIKYIALSVSKYSSDITSLLKKYAKDPTDEKFKEIENKIIKIYREDLNKLILVNCSIDYSTNYDEEKYYGEYLKSKREDIVYSIISKL